MTLCGVGASLAIAVQSINMAGDSCVITDNGYLINQMTNAPMQKWIGLGQIFSIYGGSCWVGPD